MEEQIMCREVVGLVTEYFEGTLEDDVRTQMERHLAGCDGCTNYLDQMRQTIRLTGQVVKGKFSQQQRTDLLKLFREWKDIRQQGE